MLQKSRISGFISGTESWGTARLAKFTSSNAYKLCGTRGLGDLGYNYIRTRIGEEMTGISSDKDLDLEQFRWGLHYEAEAVNKYGLYFGLKFIVVQQLIVNGRFGSTPDGLIILSESPDKKEYQAETLEVKCPPSYDAYIKLFECNCPKELKECEPKYYWQVIDQMEMADAFIGNFMAYHPEFKAGNMRMIKFDKRYSETNKNDQKIYPINEDIKLLKIRKSEAEAEFNKRRDMLLACPRF